ncbi:PI-PLC X domain-containing protein [Glycine soja]|uniref:PI-PLC X domain-containing protein n=1 Tax=Glycine soja TaxID=3848 RepID=A0A0B2Q1X2_GLYSO|nr:PI-PLC X domain-containing protein [Glycine soja]
MSMCQNNSLPFNKYAFLTTHNAYAISGDTLKEIEAFLSANPTEIVTIILEDYVHAPNGLTKVFTDAGLMKYWFPLIRVPRNGQDWPSNGDGGRKAGSCPNRAESSPLNDKSKSLVLVNYFRSTPIKPITCEDSSGELINMIHTCYGDAGNRWANFVAVDYYKPGINIISLLSIIGKIVVTRPTIWK